MDGIETKDKVVSVESAKIIYDSLLRYITSETNIYTTDESWTDESVIATADMIITPSNVDFRAGDLVICKTSNLYKVDSVEVDNIVLKSTGISLRGENGITPEIEVGTVETLPAGSLATVTITGDITNPVINFGIPRGANGTSGGEGGGVDGISPIITVTEIQNGHRVTIVDINGTQDFDVLDGDDGVSPIISSEDIPGGHRLTITDVNGVKTVDVMDGISVEGGTAPEITVDTEMSDTSINAVQNKTIKKYIDDAIDNLIGDIEGAISEINTIIGGE